MRHYAFNVGDYAAATAHLSDAEDLAYRRLLDAYYAREAPLPADEAACCRLARATSPAARRAVGVVLREFFALEADGWHQKRANIEIERLRIKSASARSSVNVRHNRDREARRIEDERREGYERITSVVRTNSGAASPRIPPTTHDPQPTKTEPIHTIELVERTRAASPPTTRRKARLPDGWALPKAWGEWAQAERGWPADEVRRVAALFADHWRGKGEARADWLATWRNWVRREAGAKPRPDARTDARNAFAASILGDVGHDQQTADHTDPRDISGESVRVA